MKCVRAVHLYWSLDLFLSHRLTTLCDTENLFQAQFITHTSPLHIFLLLHIWDLREFCLHFVCVCVCVVCLCVGVCLCVCVVCLCVGVCVCVVCLCVGVCLCVCSVCVCVCVCVCVLYTRPCVSHFFYLLLRKCSLCCGLPSIELWLNNAFVCFAYHVPINTSNFLVASG
jgi:hypothetical protein